MHFSSMFHRLVLPLICIPMLTQADLSTPDRKIVLDFDTALQRVYSHSPDIIAADIETDLSQAQIRQAEVIPNPEFELDVDNFGGSRGFKKFDSTEVTYSVTQLIELGGKRRARVSVAEQEEIVAQLNLEQVKFETRLKLLQAFVATFSEQELLNLARQKQIESEKVLNSVKGKVEAGKVPPTQQHKAEIALIRANHDFEHEFRQFSSAKYRLASQWGAGGCLDFDTVSYRFYEITPPPAFCGLNVELDNNLDLEILNQEIAVAEQNICLTQAESVPDIFVNAGVVNIKETHDTAATFSLVVPIPIFDRNKGNIDISHYELCLAETKRDAMRRELETNLLLAYEEWVCSYHEAISLRDNVLNKAEESFQHIQEGYAQGKYEFLEVLDAQRTLTDIQESYIDAVRRYHLQKAEVESLIGKCLS